MSRSQDPHGPGPCPGGRLLNDADSARVADAMIDAIKQANLNVAGNVCDLVAALLRPPPLNHTWLTERIEHMLSQIEQHAIETISADRKGRRR